MKLFISIAVILSLAGISLFGFLAMNHGQGMHTDCFVAFANRALCLGGTAGDFSLVDMHFSLLRTFSSAYMSGSLFSLLLTLFASLVLTGFTLKLASAKELVPLFFWVEKELLQSVAFSRKPISDWLAFHVNSPAFS